MNSYEKKEYNRVGYPQLEDGGDIGDWLNEKSNWETKMKEDGWVKWEKGGKGERCFYWEKEGEKDFWLGGYGSTQGTDPYYNPLIKVKYPRSIPRRNQWIEEKEEVKWKMIKCRVHNSREEYIYEIHRWDIIRWVNENWDYTIDDKDKDINVEGILNDVLENIVGEDGFYEIQMMDGEPLQDTNDDTCIREIWGEIVSHYRRMERIKMKKENEVV